MAQQPADPASSSHYIDLPPPSASTPLSTPFTPHSSSVADDSDAEFDPTPLQSPGGPDYDDLPPSYDEAHHQAISDARNGVTPLDPSQIEAHRLTLNEGPNEPEIWEYRIRGEELDTASEQAPEYSNITDDSGSTTVPVQHVQSSANIPVGRTGPSNSDPNTELLNRALSFTRHEPDADIQHVPRLTRHVAIPQRATVGAPQEPVRFLRGYAKALHPYSIRPAEFTEFLDGLNAVCVASRTTLENVFSTNNTASGIVHDYIRRANEAFFAPRGLRVSLQSLSTLVEAIEIPTERGQRADAVATALNHAIPSERQAQALHPWIEPIETDVPAPSTKSMGLIAMAQQISAKSHNKATAQARGKPEESSKHEHGDPTHSSLDNEQESISRAGADSHRRRGRGRGGHRGGPWSPFAASDHVSYGAPGNGPSGRSGQGTFGGRGLNSPGYTGNSDMNHSAQPDLFHSTNDWASWGQNIGKLGEEYGKRMADWGQQFGKQAEHWGQDFGKQAEHWGQDFGKQASMLGRDIGQTAGAWGQEVSARASGSGSGHGPATMSAPADDALPPSYDESHSTQQSGVIIDNGKSSHDPPNYDDSQHGSTYTRNSKDDDASSISSDSSDSDSDSDLDSDDDELPDTQAIFVKRIQSIDKQAEASARKGKKSPEEIAEERASAIESAENEKFDMDEKIEEKMSKRAMRQVWKQLRRNLVRGYRQKKRDLRAAHSSNGKGKGKAKKTPEWKAAKKEYKEKKKELRKKELKARQEWKVTRLERLNSRRAVRKHQMVWVVVENLDP
jgi:hypothetical protein